ncbi:MAG: purine/pyrimidine permease, partial [Alistipes sp.]|nr:purine/pyrimidine permease [Alistipes sp.]
LAIAVVATSTFVATGTDAEKMFFAQKMFAIIGVTTIVQIIWGHRLPLVVGPAAVLLVGVITSLKAQAEVDAIYSSILVGGALVTLLGACNALKHVVKLFTPRIIVVILMLIAFTLTPTISNLIFTPAPTDNNPQLFGLLFAIFGTAAMVLANRVMTGVWKSIVIPLALIIGSGIYYAIYPTRIIVESDYSEVSFFIGEFSFDPGLILAFFFCYIALLINDIGSIESLGAMLGADNMPSRCRRGIVITGVMNMLSGAAGVLGPVNYSMSPGVIASSSCASRHTLLPAAVGLIICAMSPHLIWILSHIPNPVIGSILLYLMGTQLAASFEMMHSTKSGSTFADALTVSLPVMIALLFTTLPADIVPQVIRPLVGNGFAMGVITVIIMEHVINRSNTK